MTPITPGSRPVPSSRPPVSPAASVSSSPLPSRSVSPSADPLSSRPLANGSTSNGALPPASVSPADSGQPFRATITNAAINSVRAERQRTVIPPRPARTTSTPPTGSATDYTLPVPSRPTPEPAAEPGTRANWPLINSNGADELSSPAASISAPPVTEPSPSGRVKPPWQDMPKEPPALRLVESQLGSGLDATLADRPPVTDPPSLRVIDGDDRGARRALPRRGGNGSGPGSVSTTLTALDRSTTPPVPADGSDGDLLIFAAARSAWFTGHTDAPAADLDWTNPNDSGWRAAQRALTPEIAAETPAGLPKRVPQANLVPGSPLRDERPLRIVRDAASIAAHTTGYFRGWRRGQEIGGFAMGGRPGRESAGGWDFTRDREGADEYRNNNSNNNSNSAGYSNR
jgi:hypothetical protein